jgi:hypothetical protein
MTAASRRLGALILIGFLGGGAATAYAAMLKPAAATAAAIGGGVAGGKAAGAAVAGKVTWVRNASISAGGAVAAAAVAGGIAFASGAFAPAHHSASSAVAAAGSSSSAQAPSDSSTDASPAAPSKPSSPAAPAAPAAPSAAQASAATPLVVSGVDTGDGLYFPIINGTGAPGSSVTATQAPAPDAPALARHHTAAILPAVAHPRAVFVTSIANVTHSSSTTVGSSGSFTLGPLSWVQPGADGTVRLIITQRAPTGDTTTTTVTAKMPKQTLGLSAPLGSDGSQLTITGVEGATVLVRFSDGTERQVVLNDSGRGATAIPARATSATVAYADPKTGRDGLAQTVQLAQLPVAKASGSTPDSTGGSKPGTGSGTEPGTGSGTVGGGTGEGNSNPGNPGGGSTSPGNGTGTGNGTGSGTGSGAGTGNGGTGGSDNGGSPGQGGDSGSGGSGQDDQTPRQVTDVSIDTGDHNELYPVISGSGIAGATVSVAVDGGPPTSPVATTEVDDDGHFVLPELDHLPEGAQTVTLYQSVDGSTWSDGLNESITLNSLNVEITKTSDGLLGSKTTAVITGASGAEVAINVDGLVLVDVPSSRTLDGGSASIDLGSISALVTVTVHYVDPNDAARIGPAASASNALSIGLSLPAMAVTHIAADVERLFRLELREV